MPGGKDPVIGRIEYKVKHLSTATSSKPIIDRVDHRIRQVSESDFEPESVSIGPIHRGKDNVKGMEQHKLRCLKQLLARVNILFVEKLVLELRNLEEKARLCYPASIDIDQDEFVEMLLLDGCFLIELIRNYFFGYQNDHIIESNQTLYQIRHDLMLLENQLPFFVLNKLFNITKTTQNPDDNICHLLLFFFQDMFPWSDISRIYPKPDILDNANHLLGLVYQSCFPFSCKYFNENICQNDFICISSASELKEAGIRLKGSEGFPLWDISFANGVMKLPRLVVSDKTESMLRNLMAYELRFHSDHPKYVTDYTFLMHCLIRSTKDVEILRRNGIITNFLGSDDMICLMICRLGKNVAISSDICYSDVVKSVERHCRRRRRRWMAKLRKCFNTP